MINSTKIHFFTIALISLFNSLNPALTDLSAEEIVSNLPTMLIKREVKPKTIAKYALKDKNSDKIFTPSQQLKIAETLSKILEVCYLTIKNNTYPQNPHYYGIQLFGPEKKEIEWLNFEKEEDAIKAKQQIIKSMDYLLCLDRIPTAMKLRLLGIRSCKVRIPSKKEVDFQINHFGTTEKAFWKGIAHVLKNHCPDSSIHCSFDD